MRKPRLFWVAVQLSLVKTFVRKKLIDKNVLILPKRLDCEEENITKAREDALQKKHVKPFVLTPIIIIFVHNTQAEVVRILKDLVDVIVNLLVGNIVNLILKNVDMWDLDLRGENIILLKCVVKLLAVHGLKIAVNAVFMEIQQMRQKEKLKNMPGFAKNFRKDVRAENLDLLKAHRREKSTRNIVQKIQINVDITNLVALHRQLEVIGIRQLNVRNTVVAGMVLPVSVQQIQI